MSGYDHCMFIMKLIVALALVAVAAFFGFGFLATFERAPGFMAWRIGYGVIGLACLAAAAWLLWAGGSKPAHGTR